MKAMAADESPERDDTDGVGGRRRERTPAVPAARATAAGAGTAAGAAAGAEGRARKGGSTAKAAGAVKTGGTAKTGSTAKSAGAPRAASTARAGSTQKAASAVKAAGARKAGSSARAGSTQKAASTVKAAGPRKALEAGTAAAAAPVVTAKKPAARKAATPVARKAPAAPERAPRADGDAFSGVSAPKGITFAPAAAGPAPRSRPPAATAPAATPPAATPPAGRRWEVPVANSVDGLRFADRVRRAAVVLLVLGLCGYLIDGANRPANPYLLHHGSTPPAPAVKGSALKGSALKGSAVPTTTNRAGGASGAVGIAPSPDQAVTPVPIAGPAASHPASSGGGSAGSALAGFPTATLTVLTAPGASRTACVLEATTQAQQEQGLMNQTSLGRYAGMAFVFGRPSRALFYMRDTPMPLSIAWFAGDGSYITSRTMPPCPPTTVSCPTYSPGVAYYLALEVPAGALPGLGIGPGSTVQLGGACS